MKEFLLVFRRDKKAMDAQHSAGQMQTHLKHWDDWLSDLASQNILVRPYHSIDSQGIILNPDNTFASGPYCELKESITGMIVINAIGYAEAVKIAQGCPVLEVGGNVEIRLGN